MTRITNVGKTEISHWSGCEYRVYTEDRNLYERLVRRKGCEPYAVYQYPEGLMGWDVIVPGDQIDAVQKLLKSQSRPSQTATKRGLNDNDLRDPKSS